MVVFGRALKIDSLLTQESAKTLLEKNLNEHYTRPGREARFILVRNNSNKDLTCVPQAPYTNTTLAASDTECRLPYKVVGNDHCQETGVVTQAEALFLKPASRNWTCSLHNVRQLVSAKKVPIVFADSQVCMAA